MSIASTNVSDFPHTAVAKDIFRRFLWKEYRMLRGFWLAVVVLGLLTQLTVTELTLNSTGNPLLTALVAWGAAALYAVGAAVTLFSAESEERTRGFLLNLPGRWLPMFAGKVTLAIVSAFCLGLVLCVTGCWVCGGVWPTAEESQMAVAAGGVAVLEATAWGLLFSLWLKQPLLAAVLAIGAASFGAQLAIAAAPLTQQPFTVQSYSNAALMRLLLLLPVFAVDVLLGVRWFQVGRRTTGRWKRTAAEQGTRVHVVTITEGRGRIRLMARLLWQTWRESWKTMLAAIPIALFLMASLALPLALLPRSGDVPLPMVTLLFLPALYGALVFRADQRGGNRQFLVAHAARPRYVWLARHLVWGSGLLILLTLVTVILWLIAILETNNMVMRVLERGYGGGLIGGGYLYEPLSKPWQFASHLRFLCNLAWQLTSIGWVSIFTAYALGQVCSLMLRREVLAGVLALLFSVLLVAWAMVVGLWQLNPLAFVLPLGMGAMLATWLRIPNWVVGRNRAGSWVLPLVALIVPFFVVGVTLPSARLGQLDRVPSNPFFLRQVKKYEASRIAGSKVAEQYFKLFTMPADVVAETDLSVDVDKLIALTNLPMCFFNESQNRRMHLLGVEPLLLKNAKRLEDNGELEAALELHLAWKRFNSQRILGQSMVDANMILDEFEINNFHAIEDALLRWAKHSRQTSGLIRSAIRDLEECPVLVADPLSTIFTTHGNIREVVLGNEPSSILDLDYSRWTNSLAYLANQLPWERQRALQALDLRTSQIAELVSFGTEEAMSNASSRRQIAWDYSNNGSAPMPQKVVYGRNWGAFRSETENAMKAYTSYLVTKEMNLRLNVNRLMIYTLLSKARRRGLLLQLALLAYRLDHQGYPESLDELVPKYLSSLPMDPYTDQPLEYHPQGFELPFITRRYPKTELAPENTPLLWCVGLAGRQPSIGYLDLEDPNQTIQDHREAESIEVMLHEHTGNRLLFTLPKIEPLDTPVVDAAVEGSPDANDGAKE